MRDPGSVEAAAGLALLVLAHLGERRFVHLWIAAAGDEGGHPAHRVRAAPVARLDEELRVRPHERDGHRHLRAVGEDEVRPVAELLDDAEDVVPAARVQARGVVAELVEDLLHLEGGQDRLDENGRLDRAARDAELFLGCLEDAVPEPRLEMALELREVEVGPAARVEQALRVVEEVKAEVEQAARDRLAVHEHVSLR